MKRLVLALVLVAMIVLIANAGPPPVGPGETATGWAMNPNSWQHITGTFGPVFGLYAPPPAPQGGAGWVIGNWGTANPTMITYAPINIELWVEMYCTQSYQYTTYQYHRIGNESSNIVVTISGLNQSNNGQVVSLDGTPGNDNAPTNLWFRHNIFNNTTPGPDVVDLTINWWGKWGNGLAYGSSIQFDQALIVDPTSGDLSMSIPSCDHWFQFIGTIVVPYHVADGYYSLTMAGCPAPEL